MNERANIYHFLAEALSEPPAWLCLAGLGWPLYASIAETSSSSAAHTAVHAFVEIPAETLSRRQERYRCLITGGGKREPVIFYESLYRSGRLAGPETFAVEKIYRQNGLSPRTDELPDHASLELAFLAHLATLDSRAGRPRSREHAFLKAHAADWLISLGRQLAASQDQVYAPIGQFLAGWLTQAVEPARRSQAGALPGFSEQAACILCGFCAQVCPTQALVVQESDMETGLVLQAARCSGCSKCVKYCETGALAMLSPNAGSKPDSTAQILYRSPRQRCEICNTPTVSTAEMEYMGRILGPQPWLKWCPECRPALERQA
jgi:TorA maturation chaperone TorD/NAD-dependent dihydropyrimidine dehydrogenase PreA subunit